ncbi:hypothetical protein POM88_038178 [Heracleum sosnowskyi]|uniref:F-box protein n=1 Tax=Heracleum sosnowskyi TaxID=360622 RepID=A0AAD8HSI7_9APIA|nr:hypothetical protein POM88_038178 [Heracleum sosnowskyi]
MAGWTLWLCFVEACIGLCDKLWSVERKPLSIEPLSEAVCDDLLMEIFSRMPAECVHECKVAYEDWNTLFSTLYFNYDLFLPRASPTIMVQQRDSMYQHKLFYIDDDHRGGLKCTQIPEYNPSGKWLAVDGFAPVRLSCYGLLFLEELYSRNRMNMPRIVNPVTRGWVHLPLYSYVKGHICGAYFHPTARELCVLWVSTWITSNLRHVEFKLFRPSNYPKFCWNALSKLKYQPMPYEPPVNLYECLHWMCYKYEHESAPYIFTQQIMVFCILKEEFKLMPLVPGAQPSRDKLKLLHLLDLDGCLSIWELTDVLNIWTLEDYASWSWTKRYNIEVKLLHKSVNIHEVSVIGCQNGALVIHWIGKGIFVYHLQHKNTKKFLFGKLKGNDFTNPFLHTKTPIWPPF